MPPRNRQSTKISHVLVRAVAKDVTRYNKPIACSIFFRPYFSAGRPAINEPSIVPNKADETVKPCHVSDNDHNSCMDLSTPEITAVSKPKRKPPSAATIELRVAVLEVFIGSVQCYLSDNL